MRGTLADPKVRPDKELEIRGGAAVALGVFLTPLAALLPTIQLGLGEDHDCKALLGHVETEARAQGTKPPPPPDPTQPLPERRSSSPDDPRSRARDS